jgi:aryl-alcohol dehydrogenase-like predicted oxidoreductase
MDRNLQVLNICSAKFGFGLSRIHKVFFKVSQFRILDLVFSNDVFYFDSAPIYGYFRTGRMFSKWISSRKIERSQYLLSYKIGYKTSSFFSKYFLFYYVSKILRLKNDIFLHRRDLSFEGAIDEVRKGLKWYDVKFFDIVYVHDPQISELNSLGNLLDALIFLKDSGYCKSIGFSGDFRVYTQISKIYNVKFDVLQCEYLDSNSVDKVDIIFGYHRLMQKSKINSSKMILFSSNSLKNISNNFSQWY